MLEGPCKKRTLYGKDPTGLEPTPTGLNIGFFFLKIENKNEDVGGKEINM